MRWRESPRTEPEDPLSHTLGRQLRNGLQNPPAAWDRGILLYIAYPEGLHMSISGQSGRSIGSASWIKREHVDLQQASWGVFPDAFPLPFSFVTDAPSLVLWYLDFDTTDSSKRNSYSCTCRWNVSAGTCHESLHAGFPQMLLPSREDA
jgi:hypothetical protein